MGKKRVVIWFNEPPKAERGAFNYLTNNWEREVLYVIDKDLPNYRKSAGWDEGSFANAKVIKLWKYINRDLKIKEICVAYINDIHILAGFTFDLPRKAFKILSRQRSILGIYTERPTFMGGRLELLLRHSYSYIKYHTICHYFNKYTSFLLPLGQSAIRDYHNYGWDYNKIFNFMYNPNIKDKYYSHHLKKDDTVKFVYVGRFYNKTKGVDLLLDACQQLKGNWILHLVGGYGPDSKVTIKRTESSKNISYLGTWRAEDVVYNLSKYDVVVVPSRYDGWNLLANESVHAGIGCIISNTAGSDEVIENANSGIVFKSKDKEQLISAMQACIDNHSIINNWKKKAEQFVDSISEETVGKYLISILEYISGNNDIRPVCPWIKK